MTLRLRVLSPAGTELSADLVPGLQQVLLRAEVAFTIDEAAFPKTPLIELIDTTDAECTFVVRLLQRAGYDIEISPGNPT